jgi:hypothetical protein
MKTTLTISSLAAALLLLPASQMLGQTTGTSHPEQLNDTITAAPPQSSSHYVKPSPDVYAAPDATANTNLPAATQQAAPIVEAAPPDPETAILRRAPAPSVDPDAGIVTSVPEIPGQMNEGTILHAKLQTPLSTNESHVGDTFLAALTRPVTQNGAVLLPIGSQIRGRVSEVHGGRRISGRASIRLQPDFITLPDGTSRRLYAEVIGLDNLSDAHVNSEGTIVGSGHPKAALTAVGASTGAGAITGAVLGGGVGAAVGAGIGAGAGTIWWLKRDIQQELPVDTRLAFSLDQPLSLAAPAH